MLRSFVLSLTQDAVFGGCLSSYLPGSPQELVKAVGTLTGTIRGRVLVTLSSVRKELCAMKAEIHVYVQAPSQVRGNRQRGKHTTVPTFQVGR